MIHAESKMNHDANKEQTKEALSELNSTLRNLRESWFWKNMQSELDTVQENTYLDNKQSHDFTHDNKDWRESKTTLEDELSTISTASLDYIEPNDFSRESDLVEREHAIKLKEDELMQKEQRLLLLEQ